MEDTAGPSQVLPMSGSTGTVDTTGSALQDNQPVIIGGDSKTDATPKPAVGDGVIRENLVSTAVKFLQNPKVSSSPLTQKKQFLMQKGLSVAEVEAAVQQAGVTEIASNEQQNVNYQHAVPVNYMQPLQQQAAVVPYQPTRRWYDYFLFTFFIAGASYIVYRAVAQYIIPFVRSRSIEQQEKLESIEKRVTKLDGDMSDMVTQLKETLNSMQAMMASQQEQLQMLCRSSTGQVSAMDITRDQQLNDIKQEITSLKGILLSRKQFASVPSPSPIPSWQISSSGSSTSKQADNSSALVNGESVDSVKKSETMPENKKTEDCEIASPSEDDCKKTSSNNYDSVVDSNSDAEDQRNDLSTPVTE